MNRYYLKERYGFWPANTLYSSVVGQWIHIFGDNEEGHISAAHITSLTFILIRLDLV